MKTTNIDLARLMPLFLTKDPSAGAMIAALNQQLQGMAQSIALALIYPRIDPPPGSTLTPLDEAMLDDLAWSFHVDFYDVGADLAKKRSIVKSAIRIHQTKGTKAAVESVMSIAFDTATLEEWFEYAGDPYTFRITTVSSLSSLEDLGRFIKALESAKNVRSHLTEINVKAAATLAQHSGAGVMIATNQVLLVESPAMTFSEYDGYNKTFAEWDTLDLTWIQFSLYTV